MPVFRCCRKVGGYLWDQLRRLPRQPETVQHEVGSRSTRDERQNALGPEYFQPLIMPVGTPANLELEKTTACNANDHRRGVDLSDSAYL